MRCALVGLVLLAGCQLVFPLEKAPPDARDDAGAPTRRRRITITNPTTSVLREFPVSITTGNDSDLMTHASDDGRDLRFVIGSVELAKEIVRFEKTTGALDAWVRLPELRPGSIEIHVEYGGADVASPGPVWDPATFHAVWHMSDAGQTETDRAPGEAHSMVASTIDDAPSTTGGMAGLAREYTMTNHSLCAANEFTVGASDGLSFSAWVRFATMGTMYPLHAGGVTDQGFAIEVLPLRYQVAAHDDTNRMIATSASAYNLGTWYHLAGVVERGAATTVHLYFDGSHVNSMSGTLGELTTSVDQPCLGKPFFGLIDEARVYRRALEPDWIRAEFLNLSARQAFVKIDDP